MSAAKFSLRTRRFINNKLFGRKQMVIDVFHSGCPSISKAEIRNKLATMIHAKDPNTVVIYGMKTKFGGNQSTGFALVYNDMETLKRFEPYYRQVRMNVSPAKDRVVRRDRKADRLKRKNQFGTNRRVERRRLMKQRKQDENE